MAKVKRTIQIKRGLKEDLPNLESGEMAFCVDTKELFIGTSSNGNVKFGDEDIQTLIDDRVTGARLEIDEDNLQDKMLYLEQNDGEEIEVDLSHGHDASRITTGTIDIDRLPAAALDRLVVVGDDDERFALTSEDVQKGDTVKVEEDKLMYRVVDVNELDNEDGYQVYKAGRAAAVAWSGVEDKPEEFTPEDHTHEENEITDLDKYNQEEIDSMIDEVDGKADVNSMDIESLEGDLEDTDGRVDDNEDAIDTLDTEVNGEEGIDERLTDVEENLGGEEGIGDRVEDLEGDIHGTDDKDGIDQRLTDVEDDYLTSTDKTKLNDDIDTNAGNISTNADDIDTNAGNISTNADDISKLEDDVADLEEELEVLDGGTF